MVRQLARDLNLGVYVQLNPTMREQDGLAMSSRNAYLSVEEREAAPAMYAALREVKRIVGRGLPWGVEELRTIAADALSDRGQGRFGPVQYLDVACAATGRPAVSSGESHAEGGAVLVPSRPHAPDRQHGLRPGPAVDGRDERSQHARSVRRAWGT